MRIFLAGATGALGRRLVPLLVEEGHHVVAMTHTPAKANSLRAEGTEVVVADALDRDAVMKAVMKARPDVVVHEMTALASLRNMRNVEAEFALTNRLRTEGTEYLLAAAEAAGARRYVAQSYTGWVNSRTGTRVKTEEDWLDAHPPNAMRHVLEAIRRLEQIVCGATAQTGIVLRYGNFYGPGTSFCEGGQIVEAVRRHRFPIFGNGAGVWSFIHVDDAANATRLAIGQGPGGIYNIVDDEPAEVSVWLPDLAQALGAKPPRRLPAWVGRLILGDAGMSMMTRVRGSSNAKAKRLLGWRPIYSSWRDGFRRGLGTAQPSVLLDWPIAAAPAAGRRTR